MLDQIDYNSDNLKFMGSSAYLRSDMNVALFLLKVGHCDLWTGAVIKSCVMMLNS